MRHDCAPDAMRRKVTYGALGLAAAAALPALASRRTGTMHFDRDQFVADCTTADRDSDPQAAIRQVLARAVADHRGVVRGLGEPTEAGLDVLHRSATLTIFAANWAPRMALLPHDHRMWALIGLYAGREDNILWRREQGSIRTRDAAVLFPGDVTALDADAIHSVTNPLDRFTCGIHIYGGDFFAMHRSQWDQETLEEQPSDGAAIRAMFARENARLRGLP